MMILFLKFCTTLGPNQTSTAVLHQTVEQNSQAVCILNAI